MTLLDEVASLSNLTRALRHCRKGKRSSQGYQKFLLEMPDKLLEIRKQLLENDFQWQAYRSFYVCDPKKREILAATFKDRIVHQAICQQIGWMIDSRIPGTSYACRKGKGNRRAVIKLYGEIKELGAKRTVIKLDVKKYFATINHEILLGKIREILPDNSLEHLISSLLRSHEKYAQIGRGIPIGNVTSQHFANLYLADIDRLGETFQDVYYIRCMDDMVIAGSEKKKVYSCAHAIINACEMLALEIPYYKRIHLAGDPVPFLGFVLDHETYRPLRRNQRRCLRKLKRMANRGVRNSARAMVEISYRAWTDLGIEA